MAVAGRPQWHRNCPCRTAPAPTLPLPQRRRDCSRPAVAAPTLSRSGGAGISPTTLRPSLLCPHHSDAETGPAVLRPRLLWPDRSDVTVSSATLHLAHYASTIWRQGRPRRAAGSLLWPENSDATVSSATLRPRPLCPTPDGAKVVLAMPRVACFGPKIVTPQSAQPRYASPTMPDTRWRLLWPENSDATVSSATLRPDPLRPKPNGPATLWPRLLHTDWSDTKIGPATLWPRPPCPTLDDAKVVPAVPRVACFDQTIVTPQSAQPRCGLAHFAQYRMAPKWAQPRCGHTCFRPTRVTPQSAHLRCRLAHLAPHRMAPRSSSPRCGHACFDPTRVTPQSAQPRCDLAHSAPHQMAPKPAQSRCGHACFDPTRVTPQSAQPRCGLAHFAGSTMLGPRPLWPDQSDARVGPATLHPRLRRTYHGDDVTGPPCSGRTYFALTPDGAKMRPEIGTISNPSVWIHATTN